MDSNNKLRILGYFSNSIKAIKIPDNLSKSRVKKLDGLNKNAKELKCYLIGQLGKNDTYRDLIEGKEVLDNALNIVQKCYELIGMRVVLVECTDNQKLIDFYETNQFQLIGFDEVTKLLQFVTTIPDLKPKLSQLLNLEKEKTS